MDIKNGSIKQSQSTSGNVIKPLVSVIIPVYNAQATIERTIRSVLDTPFWYNIEIIVIDDCSSDDTINIVKNIQYSFSNIYLYILLENSGGPSTPRNFGIEHAHGIYMTFLDDDDWVDADRMLDMVNHAVENHLDFLKGYLYIVKDNEMTIQNRLATIPKSSEETRKMIISFQSTTQDFIVSSKIIMDHKLRYSPELKIGEDTVFILSILCHSNNIAYIDNYFLFYSKNAIDSNGASSTQFCDDREINDQITAWERAENILSANSLSYYETRLHAGYRNLLLSIVKYSKGINEKTYLRLHKFSKLIEPFIRGKMNLHKRYDELYQTILSGNYYLYLNSAKRRLLIAGYDLKFITPIIPYLKDSFNIEIDEWIGHNAHDKKQSKELSEWADIIWCEWLLGNATFYTKAKNENQRLIIRAHRFEINRDFGSQVDYKKVDIVITVGYYYFEKFMQQFSIPSAKMRLLPNYVENSIYTTEKSQNSRFHIGLVGVLPARKGFYRSLELLTILRKHDDRFKLIIMGQRPEEVSWIKNNPEEIEYYNNCSKYIFDNSLNEYIIYGGYLQRNELYYDIGYVLSLSDSKYPESFHLTPAEGACAGSMGILLRWPGVEYIYPKEVIFNTIIEIASEIIHASTDDNYYKFKSFLLRDFVLGRYNITHFLAILHKIIDSIFL